MASKKKLPLWKRLNLSFDNLTNGQRDLTQIVVRLNELFNLNAKPKFPLLKNDTVVTISQLVKSQFKKFQSECQPMTCLQLSEQLVVHIATFLWRLHQLTLFAKKALSPNVFMQRELSYFIFDRPMNQEDATYFKEIGIACCQTPAQYDLGARFNKDGIRVYRGCLNHDEKNHNQTIKNHLTYGEKFINERLVTYILCAAVDTEFRLTPLDVFMTADQDLFAEIPTKCDNVDLDCFMLQFVDFVEQRVGSQYAKEFQRMSEAAKHDGCSGILPNTIWSNNNLVVSDKQHGKSTKKRQYERSSGGLKDRLVSRVPLDFQPLKKHCDKQFFANAHCEIMPENDYSTARDELRVGESSASGASQTTSEECSMDGFFGDSAFGAGDCLLSDLNLIEFDGLSFL
jgi:hypothetical protein